MRARQLIDTLKLEPHPEGGWFREIFRSTARVMPADGRPARDALTTIYYLLEAGNHSRWHRVQSDEVWIHLEGAPLALWTCDAALRTPPARLRLGPIDSHGTHPQHTVAAGQWQAARPIPPATPGAQGDGYTLMSCTVGPGFDFADFAFMQADGDEAALLRHHWPELAALI